MNDIALKLPAAGDFQVLAERKRRALRIHLRGELERGLKLVRDAVIQAT